MNNPKRILTMFVCFIILTGLMTGCKGKLIKTEATKATATIVSTDYFSEKPEKIGKRRWDMKPAEYLVIVSYDNTDYRFNYDDSAIYDMCKNHVGESVICTLESTYYENATYYNVSSIDSLK